MSLAVCILIGMVLALLWDVMEPDAITVSHNSVPRLFLSLALAIATVILLLGMIGASGWQIACALLSWLLLAALAAAQ